MVGTTMASIILKLLLEHDCIFNWTTSNFSQLVFVEPNTFIDKFSLLITGSFSCSFTSFVKKLFWEQLSNKTLLCPFDVELTDETKACDVWSKTFFCAWEFSANRVVVVLFPIFSFWIRFSIDKAVKSGEGWRGRLQSPQKFSKTIIFFTKENCYIIWFHVVGKALTNHFE